MNVTESRMAVFILPINRDYSRKSDRICSINDTGFSYRKKPGSEL